MSSSSETYLFYLQYTDLRLDLDTQSLTFLKISQPSITCRRKRRGREFSYQIDIFFLPCDFRRHTKRQLRECAIFSPDGDGANRRWKLAQLVEQLPGFWLAPSRAGSTESRVVIGAVVGLLNVRRRPGLSPDRARSPIGRPSSGAIPQSARPPCSRNCLRCPTSRPSRSATAASPRRAPALLQGVIHTASLALTYPVSRIEFESSHHTVATHDFVSRIWYLFFCPY